MSAEEDPRATHPEAEMTLLHGGGETGDGAGVSTGLATALAGGVAALVRPIAATGRRPLDVGAFLLSVVVVLPLMARGSVLDRREGGALVVAYAAHIVSPAV